MRQRWWFVMLTLVACVDLDKDSEDAGEVEMADPDVEPAVVECAPRTLDFELSSMISACHDPDCQTLAGPWHGSIDPVPYFDVHMLAQCRVSDAVEVKKGVTRWLLTGCVGQQVPPGGALVLSWQPGAPLPLPLSIGQVIRLRYRATGSDTTGILHQGWSLRDDTDALLAFHSTRAFAPDPWLAEPFELAVSHQDCTPATQCNGTAFSDQLSFTTPGHTVTIADGNTGTFASGDKVYDAYVFTAHSGTGFACAGGSLARYELAFLAR